MKLLIDFLKEKYDLIKGEINADNLTLKQLTALLTAVADEVSSNEA